MTEDRDTALRDLYAPARDVAPSDAMVAAVLERLPSRQARRRGGAFRRLAAPALVVLAALAATTYAVPATRAAIDGATASVAEVFEGWFDDASAPSPGRALRAGETAPAYFESGSWSRHHIHAPRVIAEAGGYKLYAFRERNGRIGFDLGDTGVAAGGFTAAHFNDRSLYLLGPGAMKGTDSRGRVPWFGIAARSVVRIEVTYRIGPPLRVADVEGGFVLLVRPAREPRQVVAFDAEGEVVARKSIAYAYRSSD